MIQKLLELRIYKKNFIRDGQDYRLNFDYDTYKKDMRKNNNNRILIEKFLFTKISNKTNVIHAKI